MKLRHAIFATIVSMLLLCAPSLRAQDGLLGALAPRAGNAHELLDFEQHLAAADFDNDQRPDGAVLLPAGLIDGQPTFRIELHVTAGKDAAIVFSTAERSLSIAAVDVNRDGAPDIVIEKPLTGQRLEVYLNDGHGAFHKARSELYAIPDPFAPKLQTWFTQLAPPSYILTTRGFEMTGLNAGSTAVLDQTRFLRSWPENLLLQSGPRAPSHSRAPPAFHSI